MGAAVRTHKFDVVVVGGGCSGVSAAIAAARAGARTALIEASSAFGGMATCGMVPTLAPFTDQVEPVVRGVGLEMLERLLAAGGATPKADPRPGEIPPYDWTRIDAEKLKLVLDRMVAEAAVRPRLFTMMAEPVLDGGRIAAVTTCSKSGIERWEAAAFVDCTGDADLAARAGCPFHKGADDAGLMQPTSLCFLIAGLRDAAAPGSTNPFREAVRRASLAGRLSRPHDHLCINGSVTAHSAGFNYKHQSGTDGTDADSITRAAMEGRRLAHELCDFLRADLPGCADAFVAATASLLGVRETRRIDGEYTITIEHYFARTRSGDDIADYCREIDVHTPDDSPAGVAARVAHHNETLAPGEHYGIPYRALIPRGVANLLVAGRSISTDRQVQGSTRQMPCTFATGQAAGVAAALAADATDGQVRAVDIPRLQQTLRAQGAFIDLPAPAGAKA